MMKRRLCRSKQTLGFLVVLGCLWMRMLRQLPPPTTTTATSDVVLQNSTAKTTVSTLVDNNAKSLHPHHEIDTSSWPKFWSVARKDRSGAIVHDMLRAHAYAFAHNHTYGGACICCPPNPSKHKTAYQQKKVAEQLLQQLGWHKALQYDCPPNPSYQRPELLDEEVYRDEHLAERWNSNWQRYIHSQLTGNRSTTTTASTSNDIFTIAVHIRRGDVTPCKLDFRYLPNSHYLQLIQQHWPKDVEEDKVQVHIYSQNSSFEDWLPDFASPNYHLHLDTDLGNVWKGLLQANVMILSRSSFSYVPALLSSPKRTKVVYTQFWDPPLPGWVVVTNTSNEVTQELKQRKCLKKKKKKAS